MKTTMIKILILSIAIFIFIFIALCVSSTMVTENFENKKWGILLTMCVKTDTIAYPTYDHAYREELYPAQVSRWLDETNLPIFVVESSGNGQIFDKFKDNKRFSVVSFTQKTVSSSSEGESASMKFLLSELESSNDKNFQECTHILKVTGRYFLPGIEEALRNAESNVDILLQIHKTENWQNSEYFGMSKSLLHQFIDSYPEGGIMEEYLYSFTQNRPRTTLGPFENSIARGGDKAVLKELFIQ